jgi:hypothetical protein
LAVRDLEAGDIGTLKTIHSESAFDYRFPDVVNDPLFVVKKVVEEDGKVVQGIAVHLTADIYLWLDTEWKTPLARLNQLKALIHEAKQEAWSKGLDEVYCVLPPEIEEEFGPVLEHLGLTKDRPWPKYSLNLGEI